MAYDGFLNYLLTDGDGYHDVFWETNSHVSQTASSPTTQPSVNMCSSLGLHVDRPIIPSLEQIEDQLPTTRHQRTPSAASSPKRLRAVTCREVPLFNNGFFVLGNDLAWPLAQPPPFI